MRYNSLDSEHTLAIKAPDLFWVTYHSCGSVNVQIVGDASSLQYMLSVLRSNLRFTNNSGLQCGSLICVHLPEFVPKFIMQQHCRHLSRANVNMLVSVVSSSAQHNQQQSEETLHTKVCSDAAYGFCDHQRLLEVQLFCLHLQGLAVQGEFWLPKSSHHHVHHYLFVNTDTWVMTV